MNAYNLNKYDKAFDDAFLFRDEGKVSHVIGAVIRGYLPGVMLGSLCQIDSIDGKKSVLAEVVGFQGQEVLMMAFSDLIGVGPGSRIILLGHKPTFKVGPELLGRVIDGLGNPMDDLVGFQGDEDQLIYQDLTNPLKRPPIHDVLSLGVRAVDGLLTLGQGQRIGIMAGSGVGKSVLLGMMAKNSTADVNVIALIGERGREVREFIENILGPEGLKKSVVVVATSDQSALMRTRAAFVATAIAEYFCAKSKNVLLMMDSVTRFAMAQREIGLSRGEPPASKGYTPSVFALLPKLLERAGTFEGQGSITGLYTVLVEGDDMDEPIADSVRSIVDGHIVLSRKLAHQGHFPAIDVLQSTSRVMKSVVSKDHIRWAISLRENLANYREAEDLINIGAYKSGTNPKIDQAMKMFEPIQMFLRQSDDESTSFNDTLAMMQHLSMR